jgi:hypothetical protein
VLHTDHGRTIGENCFVILKVAVEMRHQLTDFGTHTVLKKADETVRMERIRTASHLNVQSHARKIVLHEPFEETNVHIVVLR